MRRRLSVLLGAVLVAASLSVAALGPAHATTGCQVTYRITASATNFFVADVTLTNLGDPVTSWELAWSFTAGQTVTQGWNGDFSQSGADITVTNAIWNGTLATGASATIGFTGTWSGTNPPPTHFSFNGTLCDGDPPDPTASPTAGPTTSPTASPTATPTASPTGPTPPLDPVGQVLDVDLTPGAFDPVRRVASGGVHALALPDRPADPALQPLRLNTVIQQAPHVNPSPTSGDPLLVAAQANRLGVGQYIRMSDILPGYPYVGPNWGEWLTGVDMMVTARLAAHKVSNIAGWEIWNEPDQTWDTGGAGPFNVGWVRTYRQIRYRDTATPIVGPSLSRWDPAFMESFLDFAKENDALPQVMSWHETENSSSRIAANVAAYRQLEASLGIEPLPISISGYGGVDEVDVPGRMASYIAKLERAQVTDAQRAFWFESGGTVNGLVVNNNQPTASWWLYKWYGDMAGNMIETEPPSQHGLDGFASHDGTRRIVHVVVGDQAGTNSVRLKGLDLDPTVRVTVEATPPTGRLVAVTAPTAVSDQTYQVVGGQLVVHIPNMAAGSAYHLTIQPASGAPTVQTRYEAENASLFRAVPKPDRYASNGGYVGDIAVGPDPRFGSYVDFTVRVPTAGYYTMAIRYSNGGVTNALQGLSVNGGAYTGLSYGPTLPGVFSQISTSVTLNAGYNIIRLAKCAPTAAGTTSPGCAHSAGSVDLDYIDLW